LVENRPEEEVEKMIEIRELESGTYARTPKGHQVLILRHVETGTVVKVLSTNKELEVPRSQMVEPVEES
jgi:hypothetical protein